MRTALICHRDSPIGREALAAWLASFSDLCGIVEIDERRGRLLARLRFEARRSGLRLLDVLAFRLYYKLRFGRRDNAFMAREREMLRARYGDPPADVPLHATTDPNSAATRAFLERIAPDMVLARCKTLLAPEIFSVPSDGTMVVHPGICPEYRNAHGCFWALASRDLDRVGATLLRIDEGIDTGPVFAYYGAEFDELEDSHAVIQHRVVFDNLDAIAADLAAIHTGERRPIDTSGRESSVWGQPRLSDWLRWKRLARRERAGGTIALLYHDVVAARERDGAGFPGPLAAPYKLTPEDFERHLAELAARGVEVGLLEAGSTPAVALTFDDGGSSALEIASALERHGWRGHFFVTSGRVDTPGFLTAEGVRELRDRGHVVGSHSHTHPTYMGTLSASEILSEWTTSRRVLAEILGEPPALASVPGGYLSREVIDGAAAAGYSLLMTSDPTSRMRSRGEMKVLGRFAIRASTPPSQAAGYATGSRAARGRLWLSWQAKSAAKRVSPRAYELVRRKRRNRA